MKTRLLLTGALAFLACRASADISDSGNLSIASSAVVGGTMTVQGSAFSVGGSTLAVAGGNVGIGTAAPGYILEVAGNAGANDLTPRLGDTSHGLMWMLGRYRKPVLEWVSTTTIDVEANTDVSSQTIIVFPDRIRAVTVNQGIRQLVTTSTASFTSSSTATGGYYSGLGGFVNSQWYAVYAVGVSSVNTFVLVADVNWPEQSKYATLNSEFGANNWVYLGTIRYGTPQTSNVIVAFGQSDTMTMFLGGNGAYPFNVGVWLFDLSDSTYNERWSVSVGYSDKQIPPSVKMAWIVGRFSGSDGLYVSLGTSDGTNQSVTGGGSGLDEAGWVPSAASYWFLYSYGTSSWRKTMIIDGWVDRFR